MSQSIENIIILVGVLLVSGLLAGSIVSFGSTIGDQIDTLSDRAEETDRTDIEIVSDDVPNLLSDENDNEATIDIQNVGSKTIDSNELLVQVNGEKREILETNVLTGSKWRTNQITKITFKGTVENDDRIFVESPIQSEDYVVLRDLQTNITIELFEDNNNRPEQEEIDYNYSVVSDNTDIAEINVTQRSPNGTTLDTFVDSNPDPNNAEDTTPVLNYSGLTDDEYQVETEITAESIDGDVDTDKITVLVVPLDLSIEGEDVFFEETADTDDQFILVDGENAEQSEYDPGEGACAGRSLEDGCPTGDIWSTNPDSLEITVDQSYTNNPLVADIKNTGNGTVNGITPNLGREGQVEFNIVPAGSPVYNVSVYSVKNVEEGNSVDITIEVKNEGSGGQADVEVEIPSIGSEVKQVGLNAGETQFIDFGINTQVGDAGSYDVLAEARDTNGNVVDTDNGSVIIFEENSVGIQPQVQQVFPTNNRNRDNLFEGDSITFEIKLQNNDNQQRTEDITLDTPLGSDSQTETLGPNEQKTIQLEINTEVGDVGDSPVVQNKNIKYTVFSETNSETNNFDLQRTRPLLFQIGDLTPSNNPDVVEVESFQAQSLQVRGTQREIDKVVADVIINGVVDNTLTLVENGNVQNSEFESGSVQVSGEDFSLQNVELPTNSDPVQNNPDIDVEFTVIDDAGEQDSRAKSDNVGN